MAEFTDAFGGFEDDAAAPNSQAQTGASRTLLEGDVAALQQRSAALMLAAAAAAIPLALLAFLPMGAFEQLPIAGEQLSLLRILAPWGASAALALAVFTEQMHNRASLARRRIQVPSGR